MLMRREKPGTWPMEGDDDDKRWMGSSGGKAKDITNILLYA